MKKIVRYDRAALSLSHSTPRYIVATYKNDGEPLTPVGGITHMQWDTAGNLIRFEDEDAVYVRVPKD